MMTGEDEGRHMLSLFSRPAVNRGCFFLFLSAVLVAVTPSLGLAHKISVLVSSDFAPYHQAIQGFTSQLPAETEIDTYQLKGKILEGREMAKRVRASASDVVLAVGLKAALVAKLEIIDIPTIFCLVLNPEDYGLPTPNMIGIRLRVPSDEQLQSLRSIIPSARTVGLLYDPGKSTRFVTQARKAAQQLGLSLVTREMTRTSDLPTTLRKLLPQIDVLWLVRDSTVITEASIPFLLETALEFRKPVFGFSSGLAQHGATASMSVNYEEVGRQAGGIAKDTLRTGEIALSASRLIAPRRTRLALNLGISRFLGLSPNPQVVQLADSVFGGSSALAQREHEQAPSSLQDITQETTLTP